MAENQAKVNGKTFETKLKFKVSPKTGELVAFVKEVGDRLLGVDESNKKKKICLLSKEVKDQGGVEANILYDVSMVKMNYKNGYVVKSATPSVFKAKISVQITPGSQYQVMVHFGNKKVYYNPFDGESDNVTVLDNVISYLRSRKDIKDVDKVVSALVESASLLHSKMIADGFDTSSFPVRFEHEIVCETISKIAYNVTVKLGRRKFVYNPFDRGAKYGRADYLMADLEKRKDVLDIEKLKADFHDACLKVWRAMEADGYVCPDRFKSGK